MVITNGERNGEINRKLQNNEEIVDQMDSMGV